MKHTPINLSSETIDADAVVVGVYHGGQLSSAAEQIDAASGGVLSRLVGEGEIKGDRNESTTILAPVGVTSLRVVAIGLGKPADLRVQFAREAAGLAVRGLTKQRRNKIAILLDDKWPVAMQEAAVAGAIIASEGQDLYRAKKSTHAIDELLWPDAWAVSIPNGVVMGESVNVTRRLVNEPPEMLYPETFAAAAEKVAKAANVDIEIWDEKKLAAEKCGSLLAVARGSTRPPRLAIMRHMNGAADAPTLGLVGKGVTFDAGGLSIKVGDGMKTMKLDMAGAGAVVGAMHAIGRLELPINVVGVIGMVENMLGGDAYKPGDVFTARNGKTIEILNTDAEGRLVLADALNVACEEGGATKLIDLATLTGACVVALGENITGLMTNDQTWCDVVKASTEAAGESAWQLPMSDEFGEQIKSGIADIQNMGKARWGGAMTAAKLLEHFVDERPWVHMDIAGPSFSEKPKPWMDAGGSGVMVQSLVEVAKYWAAL